MELLQHVGYHDQIRPFLVPPSQIIGHPNPHAVIEGDYILTASVARTIVRVGGGWNRATKGDQILHQRAFAL